MHRFFINIEHLTLSLMVASLIISTQGKNAEPLEVIIGWSSSQAEAPAAEPVEGRLKPLIFVDQRLAVVYPIIQKFKKIITSDPLGITKSWVGAGICNYTGFYCTSPQDNNSAIALASIDVNGFHLSAPTLDGFLDQLPELVLFHANSNNFSGTISANISKLPYLYELDISNNQFSGPFPIAILGMNSLSFLDIRFNFFAGAVPPQLFTDAFDALFLNNNNFMQRLPDGNTRAFYLTLANNKFFGPIPRGLYNALASLTEVSLLNNLLTGCLPYELGFLREAVVFNADNNLLTGPIPFSLGCLEKVEVLNFAGNYLYGVVPEVVCALGNLASFSLSENYFISVGPICLNLIKKGGTAFQAYHFRDQCWSVLISLHNQGTVPIGQRTLTFHVGFRTSNPHH